MKKIIEVARPKYGPVEVKNVGNNYYLARFLAYTTLRRSRRGRYLESTLGR